MDATGNNPYTLDWSILTVDSFNTKTKLATVVFNFNFELEQNIENVFIYSAGYIYYAHKNIPLGSSIAVIYDLRGQSVNNDDLNYFESRLKEHLQNIEKSIKINIIFNK